MRCCRYRSPSLSTSLEHRGGECSLMSGFEDLKNFLHTIQGIPVFKDQGLHLEAVQGFSLT